MRIVRVANFVMPRSGGLRTALRELGAGYSAAGHESVLVTPGFTTPSGTLRGYRVPGMGGYRVLLGRSELAAVLAGLAPDRLEVSDRFTLRWTGTWASSCGIRSVMVSHESLTGLLGVAGLGPRAARCMADRLNARTAASFDAVVCTTTWAAEEFRRIGATNLVQAPLGVDLALFTPAAFSASLRAGFASPSQVLLVHCGRLSTEKRPDRSLDALIALRAEGVDAVLVVAGDGPLRARLGRRAEGHPVRFVDHVADRTEVAALLATADVVLAPGPIETFGLAALEALACGTPAVVDARSALPEVVGAAGAAVEDFAAGVLDVLGRPEAERRAAARARAEVFSWQAAVAGFLGAHGIAVPVPV